jgi:hypothetical protein
MIWVQLEELDNPRFFFLVPDSVAASSDPCLFPDFFSATFLLISLS